MEVIISAFERGFDRNTGPYPAGLGCAPLAEGILAWRAESVDDRTSRNPVPLRIASETRWVRGRIGAESFGALGWPWHYASAVGSADHATLDRHSPSRPSLPKYGFFRND